MGAPALPRCQRPVAVHGLVPVLLVPTTMPLEMIAPGPAPALPKIPKRINQHLQLLTLWRPQTLRPQCFAATNAAALTKSPLFVVLTVTPTQMPVPQSAKR